mgnify:CR=1 FL=1
MNISIVALAANGMPQGIYTFPAGLGCHGVTFGLKQPPPQLPGSVDAHRRSYLAYVTNTVERVLGRAPGDFTDYATRTAATGIWTPPADR